MGLSLLPLGLLLIWLIFLSSLALPNMGGSGLKLPDNILTWVVIAAVTTTLWLILSVNSPILLSVTARWLLLAVVILDDIPRPIGRVLGGHAGLSWLAVGFFTSHGCNITYRTLPAIGYFTPFCWPLYSRRDRSVAIDLTGNPTGLV